jgi:hypothetical protein
MARRYPAHPPRDAFAAELRTLYNAYGCPRYKLIIKLAPHLKDLYPELANVGQEVTFSKSTISMILNGRRAMLPDPLWVACFVLCCQHLAVASGHLLIDPGRGSLPHWQALLGEAEDQARRLGLPVRQGPHAPAVPPTTDAAVPVMESAALFGAAPAPRHPGDDRPQSPGNTLSMTGPIRLSDANYEHVASFEAYGRTLLVSALARDPHAVYQVAVLLAADQSRSDDALSLLTASAATGHPRALALLQASPRHLDRRLAATHAHELAKLTHTAGFTAASLAFYECAARFTTFTATPASDGPKDAATSWP